MKLEKMGIRGAMLNWFKSYLSERTQYVDINGTCSSEKNISTCILQGSILGPTLFNIYINDLHHVSTALTLMFADDTCGLKSDKDLNVLIESVNRDINRMAVWFKANKLALNKSKTKYIIFRTKGKKITNHPPLVINENENGSNDPTKIKILERYHNCHPDKDCRAYKLLGVYLDEFLSLDAHTNYLIKKLNRSMYCIRMAKNNLNYKGLRALYFALIHSHLNYCPIILNCTSASNKNKIFKIQKKAIRLITNSTYNAHTTPLFLQHKILPYDKIIKQCKLVFMHSVNYNYAPSSFVDIWRKNNDRELGLQLRNDDNYILPQPRCELFKKFPIYALLDEWNNSGDLKFYNNLITYKHALREQLFQELQDIN